MKENQSSKVYIVWYDNGEEYAEDYWRDIDSIWTTKKEAKKRRKKKMRGHPTDDWDLAYYEVVKYDLNMGH
jgi:hypothetical protein